MTARVFGEDSPEANLLRRYRDEVLAGSYIGNRIIDGHYFLSPFGVQLLDRSPLLHYLTAKSIRAILPFVEWHLKKTGVPRK